MNQRMINTYASTCTIVAVYTTIREIQPALFFIDFLAPNPGDSYNFVIVLLTTLIALLIPLAAFLIAARVLRNSSSQLQQTGKTGLFVRRQKALSSAFVGIPIYINDKKMGLVDNGKTVFYEIPSGHYTIQAGKGKRASEKIEVNLSQKEQLKLDLKINTYGLTPKMELSIIERKNEKSAHLA